MVALLDPTSALKSAALMATESLAPESALVSEFALVPGTAQATAILSDLGQGPASALRSAPESELVSGGKSARRSAAVMARASTQDTNRISTGLRNCRRFPCYLCLN